MWFGSDGSCGWRRRASGQVMISPLYSIKVSPSAMFTSAKTPLPCTPELRTAIRFVAPLGVDFAAGFRGETAFLAVFLAVLGEGFFVATVYFFSGSIKDFLNTAKKFGMFNTYGCAHVRVRTRDAEL